MLFPCPTRHQLSDYALGKTDEPSAARLDTHLASCETCRTVLEESAGVADPLLAALKQLGPASEYDGEPALRQALARLVPGPVPEATDRPASESSTAERPDNLVGLRVGPYRLLRPLGAGGMGAVYLAEHERLEMNVALKILAPHLVHDAQAVARFDREMKAVGKIRHPQIVRATDAGEGQGLHFLAMEFVEGCDLQRVLRARGALPIREACEVVRQAALGLDHVHRLGLIHRDMKPSNLMVTLDGQVKVLDLGLARLHREKRGPGLTDDYQVMGTADYMSPEQALRGADVDERADVYSLGCTLYALLCGRPPFDDARHDVPLRKLMAHDQERPVPVVERRPEVPAELSALIDKALAKAPGDRIGSACELAEALAPFALGAALAPLAATLPSPDVAKQVTSDVSRHVALTDTAPSLRSSPPGGSSDRGRSASRRMRLVRLLVPLSSLMLVAAAWFALSPPHPDPRSPAPAPAQVAEADIARWAIGQGALLRIVVDGTVSFVDRVENLPPQNFHVDTCDFLHPVTLGPAEFQRLRALPQLRQLDLREALLDEALVANLRELPALHELKLRYDEAEPRDLQLLQELPKLRHLTVGGAKVGDEHLAELGRLTQVMGLTLPGTRITDSGLAHLASMRQLIQLSLIMNPVSGRGLTHLRPLPALRELHLPYTAVDDEGLAAITELPHLTWLNLTRTRISDAALEHVAALPHLVRLELDETQIGDAGLARLRPAGTLQWLSIRRTLVTDAAAEDLAALTRLTMLDTGSQLSMEAIAHLKSRLPGCSIQFANPPPRSGIALGAQAAVERKVAEQLVARGARVHVEVNREFFSASRVGDLPRQPFHISRIEIPAQQGLSEGDWQELARLKQLGALELCDVPLTESVLEQLERLAALQLIVLRYDHGPATGLEQLVRLSKLRDLKLAGAEIGDEALAALRHLTGLDSLTLDGPRFTNRALEHVAQLPRPSQLRWLSVVNSQVDNEGIRFLAALPNLDSLQLASAAIDDDGVRQLPPLPRLQYLNLAGTRITDRSLERLAEFPALESLSLYGTAIQGAGLPQLATLPRLKVLDLQRTGITDASLDQLAQLTRLRRLTLGDRLSPQAAESLRSRLPDCHLETIPDTHP